MAWTNGSGTGRRRFLKVTGAGTGLGLLGGCLGLRGGGDDDSITIGGLQPYSGPFALYGDAHTAGVEFAMDEINENGGVLDRDLEHEAVDTESDPGEARSIFTRLVEEEDAVAGVGPVSSDVGVTASEAAEDLEVPLFLHAAGALEILSKESRYTFRTALPPAPAFIEPQAQLIEDRGFESIGAIVADYAWGVAAEASIEEFLPDVDVAVAPAGESDFVPYLRDLPDDLDLMIGSGHPPGLNDMFGQMREIGLDPELFTAAVSPPQSNHGALGDEVANGFIFAHLPDVYSEEFRETAERFYEETDGYFGPTEAAGYVTTNLIAEGIEQAGEAEPDAIGDAMREIEFDTIYASPIQYTEWGELDQYELIWSGFELEAPEYYPDGEFDLVEEFRTDTLDAVDPDDF